jgi:hypothetical protein
LDNPKKSWPIRPYNLIERKKNEAKLSINPMLKDKFEKKIN